MSTPKFFEQLPALKLADPLAEFLGVSDQGIFEYRFDDVVRFAGHACPTVVGAWGLANVALKALYGDELPIRGEIEVCCSSRADTGVNGVVASIFGFLTGAAGEGGFKGLAGRYSRQHRLRFGVSLPLDYRFVRLDTGRSVDASFDFSSVDTVADMPMLMSRCLAGAETIDERKRFQTLWLDRVRRVLIDHAENPHVFIVRPATP